MIYRLLILVLAILLLIYYVCCILQYCGFITFTKQAIKLRYLIIPFYYFIFINKTQKQNEKRN